MYPEEKRKKKKKKKTHGIHSINLINCTVREIRRKKNKWPLYPACTFSSLVIPCAIQLFESKSKSKKIRDKRLCRLGSLDGHLRWRLLPIAGLGIVISSRIVFLVLLARRVDSLLLF